MRYKFTLYIDILKRRATAVGLLEFKPVPHQRQDQTCLTWSKGGKECAFAEWSKVLFLDESKFSYLFHFIWNLKSISLKSKAQSSWSNVKVCLPVMIHRAMSSTGVGPACSNQQQG